MDRLRVAFAGMAIALGVFCAGIGDAVAAPYAAIVMDARSGEILHESSPDRRLHPASLTKMMTLYMTFEAVARGQLRLDQKVKISRRAAAQPASKLGLRTGQRITIRDLIRAAAVKSANDAAVALGEAVGGSEAEFARMMTRKAQALGMVNTQFKNASGLTAKGQYSSARDMALMGRALFYDYPQYYNLFSRVSTSAGGRTVHNTNRRLLRSYRGADGIKTGYTNAAGYNLVSSAERGGERVIAVVFGGRSSSSRNARVAELLDLGFRKAPSRASVVSTAALASRHGGRAAAASRVASSAKGVTRSAVATNAGKSPRPVPRPGSATPAQDLLAQVGEAIVPAAQASESPIVFSRFSPRRSPSPYLRPGSKLVAQPSASAGVLDQAAFAPGGTDWAVQLGVFAEKETAIAELASAALGQVGGLRDAGRRVDSLTLSGRTAYRARLTGIDRMTALAACAALRGHGRDCLPVVEGGN